MPAAAANSPDAGWDLLPDGVVVAGPDGTVTVVNRAAARLLRTGATEGRGLPLEQVLPLRDPQGRDWWRCIDPYAGLATRSGHPERLLLMPDGTELFVTARFVRAGPGARVDAVVVALRGTHGRARAERDSAELVATVAHELRSPLTSVKGFTSTLLSKWERFTDPQRRLMLETVEADADRVTRLITELLDVARIDTGRLGLLREPVDVAAAIRHQVGALVASGEPPERFVVVVREPLPETLADADKLAQVLANLLENAVRHGSGTVTVVVEPSGHGTAVSVADEGEGIPPEQAALVFTRFWRGGRRGGTGLGLYIVRGLVEAHGGTITVTRAPGGGALFRFVLPPGPPLP